MGKTDTLLSGIVPSEALRMRKESLAELRAKAQARPRRILIAEDEPDIRELLKELLLMDIENVEVDAREDGPSALRSISAKAPDLIITDYKMPGMTGLEFLAQARLQIPSVPAILITAYPELDIALRAINEARVQSFLQKPIDPQQVVRVVGGILAASDRRFDAPGGIRSVESLRHQRL